MASQVYGSEFDANPTRNYERCFVPAIGAPLAADLVDTAALRRGERVLDVACGTGVVARLAAERVRGGGRVAGADINPAMLEVARAAVPGSPIEWHEANAESLPHADAIFDVVLCQMGLQFIEDKTKALREMRRVLAPGGRLVLNVPGPAPGPMVALGEALARHATAEASSFVTLVFSLHEPDELRDMLAAAGFREVEVQRTTKALRVAPPEEFIWEYACSTPIAGVLAGLDERRRAALERDVGAQCRSYCTDGAMTLEVGMTTAIGRA